MASKMGIAGRLAAWGERSQITPLLALFGLMLGLMAAMITGASIYWINLLLPVSSSRKPQQMNLPLVH